ncbi:MAG: glycosyltransferase family 4 protein [Phycisphaerae bacterium]|nr:glycosyltransferase family 4 protein [Phycisphaerae bacterium]
MRILSLSWEFPPFITGGLGMAVYGMVRSLLKKGVAVDLVLPAKGKYFFSLRHPEDVDNLPRVVSQIGGEKATPHSMKELKDIIGSPLSVYQTTIGMRGFGGAVEDLGSSEEFGKILDTLNDEYYLFRQVLDYTGMTVDIGKEIGCDIIHAHDWLTFPAGILLKTILHKPLVVHVHATEFDRAGGAGDGRIHNIEYTGMKCADKVIAVSEFTANLIMEKYHIEKEKISVVHNAYVMKDCPVNHRRIFDEPTILFMGRITLQKGPDYFIEVARRVLEKNKNARFIMAGSGDMERQVLHRAAAMGLGTRFLSAGFLDRDEVEQILATTDILLLPSVSEPFGIAPLEAMSRGAVAIVSKSSGVAEIIQNAFKIDFWDIDQMASTILKLIENPREFAEMSKRGREEVANLGWDEAADKILEVFGQLQETAVC